ncbi:myosin head [Ostertagia ostertagi]
MSIYLSRKETELDVLKASHNELAGRIKAAEAHGKTLVWVPHEKDGFALSFIISEADHEGYVQVELLDSHERQRVSRDDYQKVNPPRFDKCEDMSSMSCLNEASVLHNLRQRFFSNLIYGKKRKEMPPHIFAVTDEAYRNMLQDREDQSILCTGESGAGKTENTKKVIQYLAHVAAPRSSNSKGKFIRIHFDAAGAISGANIEFYLLEKSRILRQSADERCFHIFYQLLKGASVDQRGALLLESNPKQYNFLSNGDICIPGVEDAGEFEETMRAMRIVGFQDEEIEAILRIVSAVLLFGNLQFSHEGKNSDQAVLQNDGVAHKICSLLGLNLAEIMKAFLKPKIKVGREYVHRSQNEEQARFSVGAISKASYERLFSRILEAIDVQPSLYRIGQSKVFFRTGVIAGLEEDRDERLAVLVVRFQALCRGMLARADFNRRREKAAAIRIIQRNGLAWIRLRGWLWWRLFTKVKPLLEITNKDMVIAEKEQELKTTSEKLRRSEIFINDMYRKIEKYDEEKNRLQEKLDLESMERAEVDEERQRIAARKLELETALDQMEKQLHAEEQRREAAERERKKLMDNVHDLEHHLEEEERARQTLHLEKVEIEKKLRDLESQNLEFGDTAGRLGKEKRMLEEKVKDLSARLIDEEERAKSLLKQKNKAEISAVDLQEELEREKVARNEAESARRALDGELREEKEAASERLRKIEEFAQILSRKDAELVQLKLRNDEETASRQQLERNLRELQSQLDDAVEDLRQEQALRVKSEKARRELSEQVETYKLELEETQDKSASHHAMRTKREEEYSLLQNQLAESIRESDQRYEALRSKHLKQLEELGEEMDQLKRAKAASEKARTQLENDFMNAQRELNTLQSLRTDSERKRKMAESQLADQALRLQQYTEDNEQLVSKVTKLASDLDAALKGREMDAEANGSLLKKIANLEMEISELTEASSSNFLIACAAEETARNRSNLTVKLRKAEDEAAELRDAQDELKQLMEKSEKEVASLKSQLLDSRKRFDEELADAVGEVQRKLSRELVTVENRVTEAEAARDKAERAKVKAQQEAEDACREITEITASIREFERKQRKFDQLLAEERATTAKAITDRDLAQQQARDAETRYLNAVKELKDLQGQVDAFEKERRMLRLEVDNLASTKDDAGKSVFELDKARKRLEEELAEAREQIAELEDALQMADDAKTRSDVMHQAAKQEWERQLSQRNDEEEDQRRSLTKRLRELEEELNAEQRFKAQAAASKKKLEAQVVTLQEEIEHLTKQNEEASRQIRRVQLSAKEAETEGAEARAAMDEAFILRAAEADISRLNGELSSCQLARRKAEAERDDLTEELSALCQGGVVGQEEKKKFEKIIADLQDMLEEEQTSNELQNEKLKKAQAQASFNSFSCSGRRDACSRSQLATAEARAQMLEQQLQAEEQEKARVCRQARRLETRIMEMNVQFEEERRQIEQHRESCERANSRYKAERRRAQELEEEVATANSKYREISRQLMDMNDANDSLTREVNALRVKSM